jgi:hypothetical protein
MSIFSILAEAKILDWIKRKNSGEIIETEQTEEPLKVKSVESYLLDDIKALIEQAASEPEEKRKITEQKAKDLEIQLLMSLENEGFNLVARMNEEQIREHRRKYRPVNE